jgi:microcystin degradation protein MlrC
MDTAAAGPRVAFGGFAIECNAFARAATRADFEADTWLGGEALLAAVRGGGGQAASLVGEHAGFFAAMDAAGPWRPVPLFDARAHPNGPVPDALLHTIEAAILAPLRAATAAPGGVHAVVLMLHGAAVTPACSDPEGRLLDAVRGSVGANVPVVAVLDLHANVSPRMLRAADALVPYRTNPHVDQRACGAEAARFVRRLLAGERFVRVLHRLAILAPTVSMRTTPGAGPFARMARAAADAEQRGEVVAAAVLGGFPHTDVPDAGLAVLVHAARGADGPAHAVAARVGTIGREAAADFDPPMLGLHAGVARACELAATSGRDGPVLVADLGDNPGGGAPATSMQLVHAITAAGGARVLAGLLHDPGLAAAAHRAGAGAWVVLPASFGAPGPAAEAPARTGEVVALSDGCCTGRRGLLAGAPIRLGPCAAIALGTLTVVVSTERFSPNDPMCFEHLGLDLRAFDVVVLKSRGHFRAGFDEYAGDPRVVEVATDGVTSPRLASFAWRRRPRPVFPLDAAATSLPPVQVVEAGGGVTGPQAAYPAK